MEEKTIAQIRAMSSAEAKYRRVNLSARYGIYIHSGADDTKVIDNDIQPGCGTLADYSDNGTNTIFRSY